MKTILFSQSLNCSMSFVSVFHIEVMETNVESIFVTGMLLPLVSIRAVTWSLMSASLMTLFISDNVKIETHWVKQEPIEDTQTSGRFLK